MKASERIIKYLTLLKNKPVDKELITSLDHYGEASFESSVKNDNFLFQIILSVCYIEVAKLTIKISIDGIDFHTSCSICEKDDCQHLSYAVSKLYDENVEECKDLFDKSLETIERYKRKFKQQEFLDELMPLYDELEKKESLDFQGKARVVPVIEENMGSHYVYFKIGMDKFYVISNITNFLAKFQNQDSHRYGSGLTFVHSFDSLEEKSKELVKRLYQIYAATPYYYSVKCLELKDNIADIIFQSLKDEEIMIDNNYYRIRLNSVNPKIRIDENYDLSVLEEKQYVSFGPDNYVIDIEDKSIDLYSSNQHYSKLLQIIKKSDYPSIEGKIDDFKYHFVLPNPENFVIDEKVMKDFSFQSLCINAYFDLEDEKIRLKTELKYQEKDIKENDLTGSLKSHFLTYQRIINGFGFENNLLEEQGLVLNFLYADFTSLKKIANVYLSDSILSRSVSKFVAPNIKVNYNNGLVQVFMDESAYSEEELMMVLSAIRKKKKFILLRNKVLDLQSQEAEAFEKSIDDFQLLEKNTLKNNKELPVYYAFKSLDSASNISISDQIHNIFDQIKEFKESSFKVAKVNSPLREYQVEGVKWLNILYTHHLGGILADDMGLGKTIEIISFLKGINKSAPILIVCPKSLIFNWCNEFARFNELEKVIPIYGGRQEREDIITNINPQEKVVYLTSYDSLRNDEKLYSDARFNIMVLDEAQYIKNSNAKKTISVKNIKSENRFVLTGTPIENSVLDLWSIFNFLMPGYLPNLEKFKANYEEDDKYLEHIKLRVAPFILRRNKTDVLKDLPSKYEAIVTCEMNTEQKKIYDSYCLQARKMLQEKGAKQFDVLYLLTRLRQICVDPSLFVEDYKAGSNKIDTLMSILDTRIADGHRILIFSQFVKALEIIEERLKKEKIKYFVITGDTASKERVNIANNFNNNEDTKVGLISLKAGGTGLNLVGADTVIHVDPWWNVSAQSQATDRAHRIGQTRNVEVLKLICEDSIEQRVVELQNKKKAVIEKIISENDSSISNLSIEDLLFILK